MHNFKKVIISLSCVFIIFACLSAALLEPYFQSEMLPYQDAHLRDNLAGQIEFIAVGASNCMDAWVSQVADEQLNCTSYNLSGSMMTLDGTYLLLKKELERNSTSTVLIDLSYDTLVRNVYTEQGEGDSVTIGRLSSAAERIKYLFSAVPFNDWFSVYSYHMVPHCLEYTLMRIKGEAATVKNVDYCAKGFSPRAVTDITLSAEEAKNNYNAQSINVDFRKENIQKFEEIVEMCNSSGARVILITFPRSDSESWVVNGQDTFLEWARQFADEHHCEYYDMNLLKDRYKLWNDHSSFFDGQHVSGIAAPIVTKAICDIINKAETEDVSEYFYDSYKAMKADSPYMECLKDEK